MILGIDLGGTNIRVGAVNEKSGACEQGAGGEAKAGTQNDKPEASGGALVKKISHPSRADLPVERSLEYLKSVVAQMITPEVTAIGVGVPSVVDVERGIVYNAANIPSWREVHLKSELEKEFGVPVSVNNDANCFVLGEAKFGVARGVKDVVGVTLGTGVGGGLVFGGKLYAGKNCGAGELSSLPYLGSTYEHFCSSEFFVDFGTTGKEAAEKAKAGDAEAGKIWAEFGAHVGRFMHAVLYAYDPELVVFGGGIAGAWDLWGASMQDVLGRFQYPETVRNLRVELSREPDIAILGAAALTFS